MYPSRTRFDFLLTPPRPVPLFILDYDSRIRIGARHRHSLLSEDRNVIFHAQRA